MLNKTILTGRLAPHDQPVHHKPSGPRSATLSRQELQKIIREMLG
ncbi:MAG: hypothetical protein QM690_18215 [Sphingobium sp.]